MIVSDVIKGVSGYFLKISATFLIIASTSTFFHRFGGGAVDTASESTKECNDVEQSFILL